MSWRNKQWRRWASISTISQGLVAWRFTAVVFHLRFLLKASCLTCPSAVFGPAATTWFKFLQQRIKFKNENVTIAARVLTDQTVFASTNLFCFLSSMAIMEGTSPKDKLDSTYWTALQKNWMLWPAVQAVNFKLVPLEHRVLLVNVVSLG